MENFEQIELLYKQIQQLCFKNLVQIKYQKEATAAYGHILGRCYNLLKKTIPQQKEQPQFKSDTDKDYQSALFEEGYKLGYTPIECTNNRLDIFLHNSKAHFSTWQPQTNPYRLLQQQDYADTRKTVKSPDVLSLFKQIKKILKEKQSSPEIIKQINNLLQTTVC